MSVESALMKQIAARTEDADNLRIKVQQLEAEKVELLAILEEVTSALHTNLFFEAAQIFPDSAIEKAAAHPLIAKARGVLAKHRAEEAKPDSKRKSKPRHRTTHTTTG